MSTIKHIRTSVFQVSQGEFARIVGVNQSTVSKWESGGRDPDLDQMTKIRAAAIARSLEWSDALFFDAPTDGALQERNDCPA